MIDYSKFYLLEDPKIEQSFRAGTVGEISYDSYDILYKGELIVKEPIWFKQESGIDHLDVIYTTSVLLNLISAKFLSVLENNNITGWTSFPAHLFTEGLERLEGYVGLSVTGRAGAIDKSRSQIEHSALLNRSFDKKYPHRVGVYFQNDEWDGSDIFIPEGSGLLLFSQRAVDILEKENIENTLFIPCTEIVTFDWDSL